MDNLKEFERKQLDTQKKNATLASAKKTPKNSVYESNTPNVKVFGSDLLSGTDLDGDDLMDSYISKTPQVRKYM